MQPKTVLERRRSSLPLLTAATLMLILLACVAAGVGYTTRSAEPATPAPELPPLPEVPREFRGVWVATVQNMDWPSSPGLSVERQKEQLLEILERAAQMHLNAVVFQVRPGADALYRTELEPWSRFLTGKTGRAPDPVWDPLAFAVEEAHRRGLQLHAWFNPFRAHDPGSSLMEGDFVRRHPELVKRYGPYWWLDPGDERTREHSLRVIRDVVRRYDIDGVHIDDYFYPYRQEDRRGRTIPFPDDASWKRYRDSGGPLSRDDWRRSNIDRFVEAMYRTVKEEKPWVQVGISPFGIWRPGHPEQIWGLDSFVEIFADSRKWLREGWLDYLAPQLYWRIDPPGQSYPVLLDWWVENNHKGRHIWPGLFTDRVGSGARNPRNDWEPEEILGQVRITREQPGATGNIHFQWSTLARNPKNLTDRLVSEPYAEPALVPRTPWLSDGTPPAAPALLLEQAGGRIVAVRAEPQGEAPRQWVVRVKAGTTWSVRILPGHLRRIELTDLPAEPDLVTVTAVDRLGNEGEPAVARP